MAVRFCSTCGLANPGAGTFCLRCGQLLDIPQTVAEVAGRSRRRRLVAGLVALAVVLLVAVSIGQAAGLVQLKIGTQPQLITSVSASPSPTQATPSATATLSTTEVAAVGRSGTVRVQHGGTVGAGAYLGNDLVITAAHVVEGSGLTTVYFDGRGVGTAEIVKSARENDLALLRVPGLSATSAHALTWGDSSKLRLGDAVLAFGYPLDLGLTITSGIVSAVRTPRSVQLLQTDAAMNPGNSGGPLLNSAGELVAIADFTFPDFPGLNFGIGSTTARAFVESH